MPKSRLFRSRAIKNQMFPTLSMMATWASFRAKIPFSKFLIIPVAKRKQKSNLLNLILVEFGRGGMGDSKVNFPTPFSSLSLIASKSSSTPIEKLLTLFFGVLPRAINQGDAGFS